jgi:hypothetical protein
MDLSKIAMTKMCQDPHFNFLSLCTAVHLAGDLNLGSRRLRNLGMSRRIRWEGRRRSLRGTGLAELGHLAKLIRLRSLLLQNSDLPQKAPRSQSQFDY